MSKFDVSKLRHFAVEHNIQGLTSGTLSAIMGGSDGYYIDRGKQFLAFQQRIDEELLNHRIIQHNDYTIWFSEGRLSLKLVRDFIVQFSVFSNLFLVAQLYKTINADTLEGMRASKEILANEIGVVFKPDKKPVEQSGDGPENELVSTQGTVDGGKFHFRAAHFEWLLQIATTVGLSFDEVGKRRHGTDATLAYCDALINLYGNEDYLLSQAASYAVENWAAAGFWKQLIQGLTIFNQKTGIKLPLGFFIWHDRIEDQHAQHTQEELEELYFQRELDEDAFIAYGNQMLDGVAVFWDGLDQQRKMNQQ